MSALKHVIYGWYIFDHEKGYLHKDGAWRSSMYNDEDVTYAYFDTKEEAEKLLDNKPDIVQKLYRVRLEHVNQKNSSGVYLSTYQYVYSDAASEAWRQIRVSNQWLIMDVETV